MWIIPAILLLSIGARAQETPAWEISGGYSYLKADLGHSNFSLNGGTASATQNLNNWFGGRLEVSGYYGHVSGTNISAQTITYGPVFSYRRFRTVNPFANVQLGAIHGSQGYLPLLVSGGLSQSAYKFAMGGGGGVDVQISKRAAIRVQADYLMSRFLGLTQNNLQGTVGMVFRFGKK
jgi:hypothetical protein